MTELPEWVDGKAFAGWIEGRRPDLRDVLSESKQRTLYRFRTENGRGTLDVVDEICCRLSVHINEIPDWIWTDSPKVGRSGLPHEKAIRDKAVRMLKGGAPIRDVSETLGVPFSTVKSWRDRA